jgi:hypothetical protein
MKNIAEYEEKWDRLAGKNFATACFDQNSIAELESPHAPEDADLDECSNWGITPEEWSDAIEAALNERREYTNA